MLSEATMRPEMEGVSTPLSKGTSADQIENIAH